MRSNVPANARPSFWIAGTTIAVAAIALIATRAYDDREGAESLEQPALAHRAILQELSSHGLRVLIDPTTGAFLSPSDRSAWPTQRRAVDQHRLSLVETAGASAREGVYVDLRGQFRSTLVARARTDGSTELECSQ